MSDLKITQFDEAIARATTDIVPIVINPASTPANRKITIADFLGTNLSQIEALTQSGNSGKFITTNGTTFSLADAPDSLPSQAGNAGRFLTTNGTTASWAVITGLPSQTSHSGKWLQTDGTNATWQTLPSGLPDQTGNSGKFLTTNGVNASWSNVPGLTLPFFANQSFKTTEIDYRKITLEYDNATSNNHIAVLYGGDNGQKSYLAVEDIFSGHTTVVQSDRIDMSYDLFSFEVYQGEYLQLSNINTGAELRLYANRVQIGGSQVLTQRQPAIANLPSTAMLGDIISKVNEILAMLRTHGLIAP